MNTYDLSDERSFPSIVPIPTNAAQTSTRSTSSDLQGSLSHVYCEQATLVDGTTPWEEVGVGCNGYRVDSVVRSVTIITWRYYCL